MSHDQKLGGARAWVYFEVAFDFTFIFYGVQVTRGRDISKGE